MRDSVPPTGAQPASVWILGDQLLARHPALVAAERDHAREGLRQHAATVRPIRLLTMAASDRRERTIKQTSLADSLGIPVCVLPNTQFLVEEYAP